jgi:hypothetical protein
MGIASLTLAASLEDVQLKRKEFYGKYFKKANGRYHQKDDYGDGYSKYFWMWMQKQPTKEKALWIYHRKGDMNHKRAKNLLEKDENLQNEIDMLEGTKIDPAYKPRGIDADLMYLTEEELNLKPSTQSDFLLGVAGVSLLLILLIVGLKICGV